MLTRNVDGSLTHIDSTGNKIEVPANQVDAYYAALPSSERQEPLPPVPAAIVGIDTTQAPASIIELAAKPAWNDAIQQPANVAADPAIQAAAALKPDALAASIADAVARANGALHAIDAVIEQVTQAKTECAKAAADIEAIAASLDQKVNEISASAQAVQTAVENGIAAVTTAADQAVVAIKTAGNAA